MKQKILESLKTKYSNLGLSEDTLGSMADVLALSVTSEDGIDKAVDGVSGFLKALQSKADRMRSESAKKVADLQSEIAKLQKGNDGNGAKPEPKPEPQQGGMPDWAKSLIDTISTIGDEVKSIKTERTTENRRAQFDSVINGLPDFAKKVYARTELSKLTDEQFNTLLSETKTYVESFNKEFKANSGVFGAPRFGNNAKKEPEVQQATKEEIADVVAKMF